MSSNYKKIGKLGEGYFGEVWKVRSKESSKNFAMKIFKEKQTGENNSQKKFTAKLLQNTFLRWQWSQN